MTLYLLVLGSGILGLLGYAAWLFGFDSRDGTTGTIARRPGGHPGRRSRSRRSASIAV